MFTYDLYDYKFFAGCLTFVEVKKRQREFVKKHHPDNSGSTKMDAMKMALINAEYNYIVGRHNNGKQSFPIGGKGTVPPNQNYQTYNEEDGSDFGWGESRTTTGWYRDPLTQEMKWGTIPPGSKEEYNPDPHQPFDDDPIDPPGWESAEDRKTKTKHGFYNKSSDREDDAHTKRSAAEEFIYQERLKETENLKNYLAGLDSIVWKPTKQELTETHHSFVMEGRKVYMERLVMVCEKFGLTPVMAFVFYLSEMGRDNHLILRKDVAWFAEKYIAAIQRRDWIIQTCQNFDIR